MAIAIDNCNTVTVTVEGQLLMDLVLVVISYQEHLQLQMSAVTQVFLMRN